MTRSAALEGQGLHTAAASKVWFERASGPVVLSRGGERARVDELVPVASERSTTVATPDGRLRVATVEHLFAALAGLGAFEGVAVHVDGPEVPLLDGGARAFAEVLGTLGVAPSAPRLVVTQAGEIALAGARYVFEPADAVVVEVSAPFGDDRLEAHARWDGDAADFVERIAPARTFGFEHEVAMLAERGLASHVSPESVVVLGRERVLAAGRPFSSDEPARHKLLDLLGDLYLHGGPPRGRVMATTPGHARTHEAMGLALERGLVARLASLLVLLAVTLFAPLASAAEPARDDPERTGYNPLSSTDRTAEPPKERFLDPIDELAAPRMPAPFVLRELAHPYRDTEVSWTVGTALPGPKGRDAVAVGLLRASVELHEIFDRRFYFGLDVPVAAGRAMPSAKELAGASSEASTVAIPGNAQLSTRVVFPMPSWLAFGASLGVVVPTARFDRNGPTQAAARTAISMEPTELVNFLPGRLAYRPALDLRILRGPFVLQVRQGIDVVHDASLGSATAHGRILVHAGLLASENLEISVEGQQLYLFGADPAKVSDRDRSFVVLGPAARFAFHQVDVGGAFVTTLFDALAPETSRVLALRASVVFHH